MARRHDAAGAWKQIETAPYNTRILVWTGEDFELATRKKNSSGADTWLVSEEGDIFMCELMKPPLLWARVNTPGFPYD